MKRLLFLCGFIFAAVSVAACSSKATVQPLTVIAQTATLEITRSQTSAPAATSLYVCVELANVRSGPDTNATVLRQLNQGESVTATDKKGEWYYLGKDSSGRDSYIHDSVVCTRSNPTATTQPGIGPQPVETTASAPGLCSGGCSTPPPACVIKGNIQGEQKIYYTTADKGYSDVIIDPEHGERWFCTEAEAQAAGWTRTK